jgi:hypothetical protein
MLSPRILAFSLRKERSMRAACMSRIRAHPPPPFALVIYATGVVRVFRWKCGVGAAGNNKIPNHYSIFRIAHRCDKRTSMMIDSRRINSGIAASG